MSGRGARLLLCERLEYLERRERATGAAVRGAEYEPGDRMARRDAQNLARLLRGELSILFEQPLRMGERHVDRPNPL
jgi:hypothetical protein